MSYTERKNQLSVLIQNAKTDIKELRRLKAYQKQHDEIISADYITVARVRPLQDKSTFIIVDSDGDIHVCKAKKGQIFNSDHEYAQLNTLPHSKTHDCTFIALKEPEFKLREAMKKNFHMDCIFYSAFGLAFTTTLGSSKSYVAGYHFEPAIEHFKSKLEALQGEFKEIVQLEKVTAKAARVPSITKRL